MVQLAHRARLVQQTTEAILPSVLLLLLLAEVVVVATSTVFLVGPVVGLPLKNLEVVVRLDKVTLEEVRVLLEERLVEVVRLRLAHQREMRDMPLVQSGRLEALALRPLFQELRPLTREAAAVGDVIPTTREDQADRAVVVQADREIQRQERRGPQTAVVVAVVADHTHQTTKMRLAQTGALVLSLFVTQAVKSGLVAR